MRRIARNTKEGMGYSYMKYIYVGEGPTGIDTVPGTAERK